MFTGIVTDVGSVKSVEGSGDIRVVLNTDYDTATIEIGASIACAGVCLTVVDKGLNWFSVDVSKESLKVTNIAGWREGSPVNLERALKVGEELGGHIVTGHVDCLGEIRRFDSINDSVLLQILVTSEMGLLAAKKGSLTVDGVSLTVNEVSDTSEGTLISMNIIPHTQEVTGFRTNKVGDLVNIEFDILARYISRLQERA